jgi:hypothetical protein
MKKIARLMTLALAVFTMASCEDVPSPYGTVTPPPTPSEVIPTGDGTATNPFNVTAAVAKCKEIGTTESTEKYYVTGVVVTAGAADAQYGNATFVISDEGSTAKFTCFQVLGTDGKKMEEGYSFDVGDVVIVYGPMYNYKGNTPETAGKGAAWVISRNGEPTTKGGGGTSTDQPKGNGTKDNPYNVSGVLSYVASLGADVTSPTEVYIKGKVKDITEQFGTQYGNATFTMVDEGFDAIFTAYRILYLGNKKYAEGDLLKTGDDVIVCGKVVNFKGNVPETSQGSAYLYSLNGNTGGGGGDTPTETLGTKDNPLTVAKALEYISALEDNAKTDKYAYVKGTIKTIKTKDEDIAKYKNIDYIITDGTNEVTVFRGKNLNNTDFTAAGQINVGDEVVVYGQLTKYVKDGNVTPEVAQGNYLVSLKSSGSGGGGDTPSGGNDGSLAKPFTPAEANAFIATLAADTNTDKDYYIKGKLVEYAKNGEFSTQYGNASFYLSADGTKSGDQFYVFRTLYLGNVKYTEGTTPAVGDEIIICGQLVNYKGNTPETVANKSYIYSLNGNTK